MDINSNKVELDLSHYNQGVYVIYIRDKNQSTFTKVIKID